MEQDKPVNQVLLQGVTTGRVEPFHDSGLLMFTIASPRVDCVCMVDPCQLAELVSIMNGNKLNVVVSGSLSRCRSLCILVDRVEVLIDSRLGVFIV